MELKTNYQYTYFIHPFVVNEGKYQKYILSLIKNKRFKLKVFKKNKDVDLYSFFSPKTREYLFSSFSHSNTKIEKLEDLPEETSSAVLSRYPCTIFEYDLKEDIQGKAEEKGIFFNVRKIEIICFNTGICFFTMKTNVEESNSFADVLNFNYKFREIKQDNVLNSYDKIYLQTSTFENVNKLTEFIKKITGSDLETMKLDIDTQKFLTYSYVCIDREAWNINKNFANIEYNFNKYANFLPADNSVDIDKNDAIQFSEWKYARFGFTKQGVVLFTSSSDINNFTELPDKFENEYFYTYILNLYKRIYLKKLGNEFKKASNIKRARKKFIDFTKNIWILDVTEDEVGSKINIILDKTFELDRLYSEVKIKYDILYKESNIEKNSRIMLVVALILVVSLVFNVLNYIEIIK